MIHTISKADQVNNRVNQLLSKKNKITGEDFLTVNLQINNYHCLNAERANLPNPRTHNRGIILHNISLTS